MLTGGSVWTLPRYGNKHNRMTCVCVCVCLKGMFLTMFPFWQDAENGEDSEKWISRKEKSLGLLCHKFLARYPDYPNPAKNNDICLDDVATELSMSSLQTQNVQLLTAASPQDTRTVMVYLELSQSVFRHRCRTPSHL